MFVDIGGRVGGRIGSCSMEIIHNMRRLEAQKKAGLIFPNLSVLLLTSSVETMDAS